MNSKSFFRITKICSFKLYIKTRIQGDLHQNIHTLFYVVLNCLQI